MMVGQRIGLGLALGGLLYFSGVALEKPAAKDVALAHGRYRQVTPSVEPAKSFGPPNGALVIGGGGKLDTSIWQKFIELAGGKDAPIVIVPTAGSLDVFTDDFPTLKTLRSLGAKNVTILHTRDRKVADTEEFIAPLKRARGVWITGGKQMKLVATFLGTRTQQALFGVLERGGVIGGTSAGATIQGAVSTFPGRNGKDEPLLAPGFGLLPQAAIDQHLLARQRQNDLVSVVQERPELLGIGIDENTAVVVKNDTLDVLGESKVAIYDPQRKPEENQPPYYFLTPGDRFDLRTRVELQVHRASFRRESSTFEAESAASDR